MDDRDRMDGRPMWVPWAVTSLVLLVVAFIAYAVGARHEVLVAGGEPVVHSWHFGFPGIFGLFLLFWIFGGLRRMWWWGGCYPYYRPWRYRRRYYAPYDDEREWEEWHRREHQRMEESGGRGGASSSSGPTGPSGGNNRDAGRD